MQIKIIKSNQNMPQDAAAGHAFCRCAIACALESA